MFEGIDSTNVTGCCCFLAIYVSSAQYSRLKGQLVLSVVGMAESKTQVGRARSDRLHQVKRLTAAGNRQANIYTYTKQK